MQRAPQPQTDTRLPPCCQKTEFPRPCLLGKPKFPNAIFCLPCRFLEGGRLLRGCFPIDCSQLERGPGRGRRRKENPWTRKKGWTPQPFSFSARLDSPGHAQPTDIFTCPAWRSKGATCPLGGSWHPPP